MTTVVLLTSCCALATSRSSAEPAGQVVEAPVKKGRCRQPFSVRSALRSEASADLYNALLWGAGTGALELGAKAKRRWTGRNGFDDAIRDGLRIGSSSGRKSAETASDVLTAAGIGLLPAVAIGRTAWQGDCDEAYNMFTDAAETVALTLFVTRAIKVASGRERPYGRGCVGVPGQDERCGDSDRDESFVSGHASLAAAGAGLTCSYAIQRGTWGESTAAKTLACALGGGLAITAGVLRVASDDHWSTDVLAGFAVGAAIGYFDTWGPFDLLRFHVRTDDHAYDLRGVVLPYAGSGQLGARLALRF